MTDGINEDQLAKAGKLVEDTPENRKFYPNIAWPSQSKSEDNWKHRSKGMICGTCVFFVEKVPEPTASPAKERKFGRCRKHAPTLNGWPAIFETDWCGDHKLDENKI